MRKNIGGQTIFFIVVVITLLSENWPLIAPLWISILTFYIFWDKIEGMRGEKITLLALSFHSIHLFILSFLGLYSYANSLGQSGLTQYFSNLIMLCFILGTLCLTANLNHKNVNDFSINGVLFIFSGSLILFGMGLEMYVVFGYPIFCNPLLFTISQFISHKSLVIGVLFLSYSFWLLLFNGIILVYDLKVKENKGD